MAGDSGTVWTAGAALAISVLSGAFALYGALRGPQVQALPIKNVFLFETPAADAARRTLAAVALPEIANTAASYPDILLSQALVVMRADEAQACLSARGQVRFHRGEGPAVAPIIPSSTDVAETITLREMALEVLDVSPRAALPAGELFSRRQLFDQAATSSVVDPCHRYQDATAQYTASAFAETFRDQEALLRYEAQFAHDEGYYVECRFRLSASRADRLLERGWINVPCTQSDAGELANERTWWESVGDAFDRLF